MTHRRPRRRAPAPPARSLSARAEAVILAVTAVALFALLYVGTLDQPYHVDTTAYFGTISDLHEGTLRCGYANRCMVSYFLIPFAPLGAVAVKVGFVAAAVGFFVFAYLFYARLFSRASAYVAALAVIAIPAGLMTITHLKEDFVGLFFLALACYLAIRPRRAAWRLAGAAVFALALLSKETFLLFAPFYFAVYAFRLYGDAESRPARPWLHVLAAVGVTAAVTLAIKHDYAAGLASLSRSPYLGQFLGPFSPMLATGVELYQRGLGGGALFAAQLLAFAPPALDRGRERWTLHGIFLGAALLLAVFAVNTTVVTYRNFSSVAFLTLPLAVFGLELVVARLSSRRVARVAVLVVGAVFLLALASRSLAAVTLRRAWNPEQRFFTGLAPKLAPGTVALTMDHDALARFYLEGVTTRSRRPDPTEEQARGVVGKLAGSSAPLVLLPDGLAYDRERSFARELDRRFRAEVVHEGWYEDYHPVDLGTDPDELRARLESAGCEVATRDGGRVDLDGLQVDTLSVTTTCSGKTSTGRYPIHRGRVFTGLQPAKVYRLIPKSR